MSKITKILKYLNLKPTVQRKAILNILLKNGNFHVTAQSLGKLLKKKKYNISTATIYNNLNDLSDKGFLKKVIVEKNKMWFDTNLKAHHHFYDEEEDRLIDINNNSLNFSKFPKIPKGKKLESVDVLIKVKKI